jgi:hypothetical protein
MICVPQGALLALLAAILHSTMTSPVWMPQFLSGGQFIPHCWMIRYRPNDRLMIKLTKPEINLDNV